MLDIIDYLGNKIPKYNKNRKTDIWNKSVEMEGWYTQIMDYSSLRTINLPFQATFRVLKRFLFLHFQQKTTTFPNCVLSKI